MLKCEKVRKNQSIIWRCARVVWIIIIEMAAVNFLSLGTESCITLKRMNVFNIYFSLFDCKSRTCASFVCPIVRSLACLLTRSFDTHICCKLFSLDQFTFLLLLAAAAAPIVVPGGYAIHLGSMIDWISMTWFKEPFELKMMRIICTR